MIRKLVVGIFTALLAGAAQAQIEAADVHVGAGILGYAYSELDAEGVNIERNTVGITPGGTVRVGYALSEVLELGGDLAATYQEIEVDGFDSDGWSVAVGPYVAGNFAVDAPRKLVLTPSLSLRYYHEDAGSTDLDAFQFEVGGAVQYFLAKDASIDAGIFFNYLVGGGDVFGMHADVDGWAIGPRIGISIWP